MAPSVNWMRDEDVETGDFYNKMIIITHNMFMAKMSTFLFLRERPGGTQPGGHHCSLLVFRKGFEEDTVT